MTLLFRTSIHLKKTLTRLKVTFHETAQEYFLSSKFDNVLSTFFVDHLYPILSPLQNLLRLWHSYLGPQSIWTSPWLDWKSLFMKLHKSVFSSKFDNVLSTFFVDHLYPILFPLQNLLGLWHSYLGPQSIWRRPWLDWKSLFMKLHKSIFELEIWQRVKYFFRRSPISDIISASEPTRIMTLLLRTSIHLKKTLTRLKVTFHETAQEYFLSSKFDNVLSTFS